MFRQTQSVQRIAVLLLTWSHVAVGQSSTSMTVESVFREQARSITEEMFASRQLDLQGRVLVSVMGGTHPALAENALLESVASNGGTPFLSKKESDQNALEIVVLRQDVFLNEIHPDSVARTIATSLEGRFVHGASGEARFLGRFERVHSDTVSKGFAAWKRSEEESSFFDRALTPAILISGTVLAVYLLFTVRSP